MNYFKRYGIVLIIGIISITVFVTGCTGNDKIFPIVNTATPVPVQTVTPSPVPTAMIFMVTPLPNMVYPQANTSQVKHVITPDPSFKENYTEDEYPYIVDNGNGTVDVIIFDKSVTGQTMPMVFKNEPLMYSVTPTEDSKHTPGPPVVRGIEVSDNSNAFLRVQIKPLPDGTGNASIMATSSIGNCSFNGTITKPLDIQPVLYDMGIGENVENNRIQFAPGHYWDLAPVNARNQTFYVITRIVS